MKISVIGAAGCIGSSVANSIAIRNLADEIVLADIRQDWLEHHCIDIVDACVVNKSDSVVRTGVYEDIAGSDIVIMAAGKRVTSGDAEPEHKRQTRQQMLPSNLEIVKEWAEAINRYSPRSIVITITNPAEVLNLASYLASSGRERHRFIGYSLNDTTRLKIAIARVLGLQVTKVRVLVVGEHGGSMVPLFSTAEYEGNPLSFTDGEKEQILDIFGDYLQNMLRLNLPRTSGWLTGIGMSELVDAIVNDTGETMPCCAVLDGEYGFKDVSIGVPVVLGKEGIRDIVEIEMTEEEKRLLKLSVENLQPSMDFILSHL